MATPVRDKYFLRTLHEEIGLLDRKIAHLHKFETFASDKERDTAAAKLTTKRAQLARTAQELTDAGIEYKPAEVPQPEVAKTPQVDTPAADAIAEKVGTLSADSPVVHLLDAVYSGTALDYRSGLNDYRLRRRRPA